MRFVTALMALGILTAATSGGVMASGAGCGRDSQWSGACTVENTGTQVDVTGTTTTPGTTGSGAGRAPGADAGRPAPTPTLTPNPCASPLCRESYTVGEASEVYPEVSVADLASFRPGGASAQNEPAGVAVLGMPSNFVAAASTQELAGEVLGFPVTVRFVPVGYTFDFGDGERTSTTSGGRTWAALGQAEFTPTATSHVFRERSTARVTVTPSYRASVLFDGTFRREVPGTVQGPASTLQVRVVAVRTALVEATCAERASAPIC